jgi:oligosaccharide repeat unit polymerase
MSMSIQDILAFLYYIVNPVIMLWLTRLLFGPYKKLSFPTIFMVGYIVLIYLQAFSIYQHEIRNVHYIISVICIPYIVLFVVGFGLPVLGHSFRDIECSFGKVSMTYRDVVFTNITPLLSVLFVLLPFVFVFDKGASGIAFFFLIDNPGQSTETMFLRIGGLTSNINPILSVAYAYNRALGYPVYIAFITTLLVRKRISVSHYLAVILAGALFSLFTAAKAPLAVILLCAGLSFYMSNRGKLSTPVIVLGVGGMLVPAFIYPLLFGLHGSAAVQSAFENLIRRVTWVPSQTSAVYFDAFTNYFPHLCGASNRFVSLVVGTDYINVASFIYDNYYNATIPGGLVNASYFATFYADWGMPGVFLGTLAVCACLIWLQIFFDRWNTDAVGIAVRATISVALMYIFMSNLYSVLLGRGLLSLPLLLVVLNRLPLRQMITRFFPPTTTRSTPEGCHAGS